MSGANLTAARDGLYTAFQAGQDNQPITAIADYVDAVYDYEPKAGDQIRGCALTVASAGMTPDFFLVAVRIYQQLGTDAREGQRNLDAAIGAADELIPSNYGPSSWTIDVREDIDAVVAECILERGREDYY